MKPLIFKTACKSCMDSSMLDKIVIINGPDDELFYGGKLKSEYELNKFVVEYLEESKQPCEFCGSYNLDILDIVYDGNKAYNHMATFFDQLEVKIKKLNDNQNTFEIERGFEEYFIRKVVDTIINEINYIPNSRFEEKNRGHIRFIVSKNKGELKDVFRIERFNFAGYKKNQILELLTAIKENISNFAD